MRGRGTEGERQTARKKTDSRIEREGQTDREKTLKKCYQNLYV